MKYYLITYIIFDSCCILTIFESSDLVDFVIGVSNCIKAFTSQNMISTMLRILIPVNKPRVPPEKNNFEN